MIKLKLVYTKICNCQTVSYNKTYDIGQENGRSVVIGKFPLVGVHVDENVRYLEHFSLISSGKGKFY